DEAVNQVKNLNRKIILCTDENLLEMMERCYEDHKKDDDNYLNFGDVIIDNLEFEDGKVKKIGKISMRTTRFQPY
ncbi:10928_t:CDS:1, partial [Cetraspora pellucida]